MTVTEYLDGLPDDRRAAIKTVRAAIKKQLPPGYVEIIQSGMICWAIPLSRYPHTYNGQPLPIACLASQKSHMAIYLTGLYADDRARAWFEKAYAASGKKLDMGKSCVRFKTLDALALDVVAAAVGKIGVDEYLALYEKARPPKRK
jgi:Domain of unknown function (DU1801)